MPEFVNFWQLIIDIEVKKMLSTMPEKIQFIVTQWLETMKRPWVKTYIT